MPLEVDGRALQGEFLRSAQVVNAMIQQMSVFTSEVTRVVGTEGKLGGQAAVPGLSGRWKELTDSVNSKCTRRHAESSAKRRPRGQGKGLCG